MRKKDIQGTDPKPKPMPTKLNYLKDSQLLQDTATLIQTGETEKGRYAIFDQTIFYPRGGGQESDHGKILLSDTNTEIEITSVSLTQGKVRHFGDFPHNCQTNQAISLSVNQQNRQSNSILHTAGHLIASIIETKTNHLKAIKGFHFPGGSYVEFKPLDDSPLNGGALIEMLNQTISRDIKKALKTHSREMTLDQIKESCNHVPDNLPQDKPLRVVTIENYHPIPCGGTHAPSLAELKGLRVYKAKKKKGNLKISYKIQ